MKNLIKENEEENKEENDAKQYLVQTDNSLSLGRPIKDPVLSNMKHRAESGTQGAQELLRDLKITSSPSGDIFDAMNHIYNTAARDHILSKLISRAIIVKNEKDEKGVLITLSSVWKDDDKKGKRSYGYIRSLLIAAVNAKYIKLSNKEERYMRIEMVKSKNELLLYVAKNSKSWIK